MQLDHERFTADGFLILRGFLDAEELHDLRLGFDVLVQLSQARSRENRTADQPVGGVWQAQSQPRVKVDDVVTPETAYVVDYYRGAPMEVSAELLGASRTGLGSMGLMVSAVWDRGYTDWHRDYCSNTLAPLDGVQRDMAVNGPPYVQWNIPLYDDDVFWVVPGSHVNPDSEELKEQLLRDCCSEVPGALQADLKAGDGIVYAPYMQHWGSVYTSRMRRVIHMGYYDFDKTSSFGHHPDYDLELGFAEHLSPDAGAFFREQADWTIAHRDLFATVLRAAVDRDSSRFMELVAQAHPEESCRMVSVVHFCRMAEKISKMCGSPSLSPEERRAVEGGYGDHFWADFSVRFPPSDADELGKRFAVMSERMLADRRRSDEYYTEVYQGLSRDGEPDFDSRALRTLYRQMPEVTMDDLVSTW